MLDKKTIREKNKQIRATLLENGIISAVSASIIEKIKKSDYFIMAKNIAIFHPKKGEVNLLGLLEFEDKNFYLPRTKGDNMEFCPFKSEDELLESNFKIKEPKTNALSDLSLLDIIFIPALGADKLGNRIGYGKGFYDKFLNQNSHILKAKKIVVLPANLLCENIKADSFDVCYDYLVTN